MFGALDPAKILMILVVALIVLGPERLPRAARQLGSYWRTLIQLRTKLEQEFREAIPDFKEAMPDLDLPSLPKNPRAAVSSFITGLIATDPEPSSTAATGSPELTTPATVNSSVTDNGTLVTVSSGAELTPNGTSSGTPSGSSAEPHDPGDELAAVTAAWRAASGGTPVDAGDEASNGNAASQLGSSTDGGGITGGVGEPVQQVEQRTSLGYAAFLDDASMN